MAAGRRGRGSCASCPLAGPRDRPPLSARGSVPGLQVRSHTKPQLSSRADPLDRWIQTRLNMDPAGNIPARDAYADFCCWARAKDIEPGTETRFGRNFSARIIELGGIKVKRRDRAYYDGVALAAQKFQVPLASKAAAQLRSGSMLVAMAAAEPLPAQSRRRISMRAEETRRLIPNQGVAVSSPAGVANHINDLAHNFDRSFA